MRESTLLRGRGSGFRWVARSVARYRVRVVVASSWTTTGNNIVILRLTRYHDHLVATRATSAARTARSVRARAMSCAVRAAPHTSGVRARPASRARGRVAARSFASSTPNSVDDAGDVVDVAIVGAGPGGLATALALQSAGLDVRVFEQREEFRPAGVAIFIWPHGLNALKSIDAATCDRVVSSGAVISNIAIEQLQPGETEAEELVKIDVAGWSRRMDLPPQIGITWARLTNALREGLAPGTVRLGHRLDALDDGPDETILSFAPPRAGGPAPPPVRARVCVVGADGRNSRVRELTFGADEFSDAEFSDADAPPSPSAPDANVYYALSPNPPPGANGAGAFNELRFSLCDGSGISLLDVGRGNLDLEGANSSDDDVRQLVRRRTTHVRHDAFRRVRARSNPEERLAHLEALFRNTTPLLRASIATTEPTGVVQTRLYERASATRWSRGRVALLGDAAHCMYPSLGLGISTAFGDAVELSRCLVRVTGSNHDRDEVVRALEAYQRARVPPTWALQTASRLMHRVLATTAERPQDGRNAAGWISRGCSSKCGVDSCGCWEIERGTRRRTRGREDQTKDEHATSGGR